MNSEKQLQNYLKRRCKSLGWSFDKLESKSRRGFPDVMAARAGVVWFLELKSPSGKGRLSALQKHCIQSMKANGLNVSVCANTTEIDQIIEE